MTNLFSKNSYTSTMKAQRHNAPYYYLLVLTFSLLAPFLSHSVQATSIQSVTVEEALEGSELVIEGKVISSEARKPDNSRMIRTYVTIEIIEVVKGSYSDKTIELPFMGGTLDGRSMKVGEMDYPEVGEHGIYFVESLQKNQVNSLFGWSQGHFLIREDADGVERVTTNKNTPVMGMDNASTQRQDSQQLRKAQALSDGEAKGLQLEKAAPISKALSVQVFKRELLQMSGQTSENAAEITSGNTAGGEQ